MGNIRTPSPSQGDNSFTVAVKANAAKRGVMP